MSTSGKYNLSIDATFDQLDLLKETHIVVLHATRIPPHIGMIIGGYYHSLSIKGQDIQVPISVLMKGIRFRSIASLFIHIKTPVLFNEIYLMNRFIEKIKQFPRVDVGIATCISPIKLFFEEEYNIPMNTVNRLPELLMKLDALKLINASSSLFIDEKNYDLPVYSFEQINKEIAQVRSSSK